MNQETIKILLELVMTVLLFIIIPEVKSYLKIKLGNSKYDQLLTYIEYAVRSAEQLYKINEPEKKKKYVYNYILQKSSDLNLDLDLDLNPDDINLLVEGVVNAIKHGDA